MTRSVVLVLLLSLVVGIEALPAKQGVNRQQVVRNIQTNSLGSLLKAARESASLHKVTKINKDGIASSINRNKKFLGNMAVRNEQSSINEILDMIERDFSYTNLSRRVSDVPEAYQTAIFSTMFLALIENYSSYCPGSALANLITGYLRYSVYDLYEEQDLNDIITNINNVEDQPLSNDRSIRITGGIQKRQAGYLTNSERFDLAEDLVGIRQRMLDSLIAILAEMNFPTSDMIFWQIEYDVYLSTTQGDSMEDCVEKLIYSSFNSGYLDEIARCDADRGEVWDEMDKKLNAVIQSLENKSPVQLYGISPADFNGNAERESTISRFIGKLERFRRSLIGTIRLFVSLLASGEAANIEGFLASQLTYYTERWIRLNAPIPEEPIGDGNIHVTFGDILDDPRLNNFLLKNTKVMFTKLLDRFIEQAKAEGIQTERLLDVLSSSLDYLESDF